MSTRARLAVVAFLLAAGPLPAQDSPHGETRRPLDCGSCHTQEAWRPLRDPIDFDHASATGFPLEGGHGRALCGSCHLDADFADPDLAGGECTACHVDVHLGNLSTDCASCHDTRSFADRRGVEEHLATAFPLTGSHLQISCESCHVDDSGGRMTGLNPECLACHRTDYETASLDHVASGFQVACADCHNTIAFGAGVRFEHESASGGFALLGAHRFLPCAACHVVPGFAPLFPGVSDDGDCVGCHRADYDREHGGTGFPTDCTGCHGVDTWDDASFEEHDIFFPITSGAHAGRWSDCSDCHTVPGDYTSFTCLTCHEHSQERMDDKHLGEVPGYVYESSACLSCHPAGRADD